MEYAAVWLSMNLKSLSTRYRTPQLDRCELPSLPGVLHPLPVISTGIDGSRISRWRKELAKLSARNSHISPLPDGPRRSPIPGRSRMSAASLGGSASSPGLESALNGLLVYASSILALSFLYPAIEERYRKDISS